MNTISLIRLSRGRLVFSSEDHHRAQLKNFCPGRQTKQFSYDEVGATREGVPAGYTVDRNRVQLGTGRRVFDTACELLQRWQMFKLGWVEVFRPDTPIEIHATVGVLI